MKGCAWLITHPINYNSKENLLLQSLKNNLTVKKDDSWNAFEYFIVWGVPQNCQDLSLLKENGIIAGPLTYSKEPLILQHRDTKSRKKRGRGNNLLCQYLLLYAIRII